MPPKRKTLPSKESSKTKKRQKTSDKITQLIADFRDLELLKYTLFQPEPDRPTQAILPLDFPTSPLLQPIDYFNLFFTPDLFDIITRNTNMYISYERLKNEERTQEQTPLISSELRVFIKALIYIGIHIVPNIETYQNTDRSKAPLHTISLYISLRRFEQIKCYLHISCSETDKFKGLDERDNKIWQYKVEPLTSQIRSAS